MSYKSIRKSLTDIVEKLEGEEIPGKNLEIRQALARIADAVGEGGAGKTVVNFTFDGTAKKWVADKTAEELTAVLDAGGTVEGQLVIDGYSHQLYKPTNWDHTHYDAEEGVQAHDIWAITFLSFDSDELYSILMKTEPAADPPTGEYVTNISNTSYELTPAGE